jgi:hypothetical protein
MKRLSTIALAIVVVLTACHREYGSLVGPAVDILSIHFGLPSFNTNLGGGIRLPMSIVGSFGDSVPASARISLISRNPAIVRIDSGTFLQTTGLGSTWVVASLDTAGQSLFDSLNVSVSCTEELTVIHTPPADTIAVGASFTPTVILKGCGGQLTYSDTITWTASDTTIIRVDSASGRTTGLKPGSATAFSHGAKYGSLGGVGVTVTP